MVTFNHWYEETKLDHGTFEMSRNHDMALDGSHFDGIIPMPMFTATPIEVLSFASNHFSGPISRLLRNLPVGLKKLSVYGMNGLHVINQITAHDSLDWKLDHPSNAATVDEISIILDIDPEPPPFFSKLFLLSLPLLQEKFF